MADNILTEKLGGAVTEPVVKEVAVKYQDLLKYSSGPDIEKSLGDNHLFGVAEVYSVVASLISKQSNGEEGAMLTNGNYNLFYTEKFVLSARWFSGYSGWSLYCWRREVAWDGVSRVFSPETVA